MPYEQPSENTIAPAIEKIAELKELRREILEEKITPEKLEDPETRATFEDELKKIDNEIDEVLRNAGIEAL